MRGPFPGLACPSPYTDALRRRYRDARFLPVSSPAADFQTLRCARRLVLSISSFAWLAAWLSESATAIHLPVAGLFDPRRGRQNLLPLGDPRYRFWDVEFPAPAQRVGLDLVEWASGDRRAVPAEAGWLMALGAATLTAKVPMSVAAALAERRSEKGPAS